MDNIFDKNYIKFDVMGAIDFSQQLYIELYSDEIEGGEEIPINDFLKALNKVYPKLYHYFHTQCILVKTNHHFHARPKNIWVICKEYYHHSHWGFSSTGNTNKISFDKAIEELSSDVHSYELSFNGYSEEEHREELKQYFKKINFHGKEEIYNPNERLEKFRELKKQKNTNDTEI